MWYIKLELHYKIKHFKMTYQLEKRARDSNVIVFVPEDEVRDTEEIVTDPPPEEAEITRD